MRKPFIAGNWKMNMTQSEVMDFMPRLADELQTTLGQDLQKVDVLVGAPFLVLDTARKLNGGFIQVIAQNVSEFDSGAYTGEISVPMLQDIGINAAIVGHSERRLYYNETDQSVAAKTAKLLESGCLAVACVGETLQQREANQVEKVIGAQVNAILDALPAYSDKLVIAYEPVWAIGTGKTASKEQAQDVHAFIRSLLQERWGQNYAEKVRILYGGSVKPDNARELLAQKDIDGALVGGASLKVEDFTAIVKAAL